MLPCGHGHQGRGVHPGRWGSPWQVWFDALDAIAAAKVTVARARMELGNLSSIKWFRGIGEYRIDWGPGYRIYLAQDGKELIVLFGGSSKKDQKAAIEKALSLHLRI